MIDTLPAIILLTTVLAISFASGYYILRDTLQILKITRYPTAWSLLAGAAVSITAFLTLTESGPGGGIIKRVAEGDRKWRVAEEDPAPIRSSRLFAGPNQYPPEEFAAYGIVAFRSRASLRDRDRHLIICEAYIAGLPHASELRIERDEQMVTVWPADTDANANKLNKMPRSNICETAVDSYGLTTSLQAIKEAGASKNADISGIGPFLLAWSPSTEKGRKDALVLILNLSGVTTYRQAQEFFGRWAIQIEQNPELWRNGWDVEKLRVEIRLWVDEYGPKVFALFGAKE